MSRDKSSAYYGCGWSLLGLLIVLFAIMILSGCKSVKYVPVIEHKTDSLYITLHQRDSVWMHDSIHVKEQGDTVRIEKWHTKYISHEVHDTTYIATHDTIPQPYPVTVEVPRQLSWWQRFRIGFGEVALLLAALWLAIKLLKKRLP